jgi:hypothetical protein
MALKSLNVSQQSNSSRRALLLGLTLAEVMLILLFAFLLLLGALGEKLKEGEPASGWVNSVARAFENAGGQMPSEPPREFQELMEALISKASEQPPRAEDWMRLTTMANSFSDSNMKLADVLESRTAELEAIEKEYASMREAVDRLKAELSESKNYSQALEEEVRKLKAGSPPPCLHQPASSNQSFRGPSQPIGIVHIEPHSLTFRGIYSDELSRPLVDYWGKAVDFSELAKVIETVPINQPLTIEQFSVLGRRFRNIGDVDTPDHGRCYFTMDYVIADFDGAIAMLRDVLESFFLKQRRLDSL